jgi:hypothetical protein
MGAIARAMRPTSHRGCATVRLDPPVPAPDRAAAGVDITVMNSPAGAPGQLTTDNITVLTVPAPGAAVAIAAAGVLGAARRRRRTISLCG